jgi:hypothetical protein
MWRTHCIPVTYLKTVRWNWSYINITKVILSTDQLGDRNHIVIRTERLTNYDRLSTNKRRKQWRTGRTAIGRTVVSDAKHQKGANTAEHTPNAESQTALWGRREAAVVHKMAEMFAEGSHGGTHWWGSARVVAPGSSPPGCCAEKLHSEKVALGEATLDAAAASTHGEFTERAPWNQETTLLSGRSSSISL